MKTPPRTLGELLGLRGLKPAPDIFDRWHLSRDDNRVRDVVETIDKKKWSPEQRLQLLQTVDQIVYAKRARTAWDPKDNDTMQRYRRLAREGLRAAWLAQSIIDRCTPSWNEEQPDMRDFVLHLIEFVTCSLHETWNADHYLATRIADRMVAELRSWPDSAPTLELIAELVWLADGIKPDEKPSVSAILRLSSKKITKTQVARDWEKSWNVVCEISKAVPAGVRCPAFTFNMRQFLEKPGDRPGPWAGG